MNLNDWIFEPMESHDQSFKSVVRMLICIFGVGAMLVGGATLVGLLCGLGPAGVGIVSFLAVIALITLVVWAVKP